MCRSWMLVYLWVCAYLYIRLSGLSSTTNGLMGTLWCLSSPLEWDTLREKGSTKAQPCFCAFVARGYCCADCCWPHGDYPSQGVCIVDYETEYSTFTHSPAAPQQGAEMYPCRSYNFNRIACLASNLSWILQLESFYYSVSQPSLSLEFLLDYFYIF